MDLGQHSERLVLLDQRRVGDLRIGDPLRRVLPRNPEQAVLKDGVLPVVGVLFVLEHPLQGVPHIRIRDPIDVPQWDLLLRLRPLAEDIAV